MANTAILLVVSVIIVIALMLKTFYGEIMVYAGVIISLQVVVVAALTILTKMTVSMIGLIGMGTAFGLAVYLTYLLCSNYFEYPRTAEIGNVKRILNNIFMVLEQRIDKVNIACGVAFLLLYNFGNMEIVDISLMLLVGTLSNFFVFKYCLKCFLERKKYE
jgi:hypothetical protein